MGANKTTVDICSFPAPWLPQSGLLVLDQEQGRGVRVRPRHLPSILNIRTSCSKVLGLRKGERKDEVSMLELKF